MACASTSIIGKLLLLKEPRLHTTLKQVLEKMSAPSILTKRGKHTETMNVKQTTLQSQQVTLKAAISLEQNMVPGKCT